MLFNILTALFLIGLAPLFTGCGPLCVCKKIESKRQTVSEHKKTLSFTSEEQQNEPSKEHAEKEESLNRNLTLTTEKQTEPKDESKKHELVVEIKSEAQFNQAIQKPCVVFFGATWCDACAHLKPLFDHAAQASNATYTFLHVNADDFRALATLVYKLDRIPTILFFNEGKELITVGRLVGSTTTQEELTKKIQEAFERKS